MGICAGGRVAGEGSDVEIAGVSNVSAMENFVSKTGFLWLLLAVGLLCGGCDALVEYRFLLQNDSARDVVVHVKTALVDTVLKVGAVEQGLLLAQSQVNCGVKPYFGKGDTIWWFEELGVMGLPDSVWVRRELRLADGWEFEKGEKKGVGVYLVGVGDGDF